MSALRASKQRDAVLKNLISRFDHPSAEDIYLDVKKEIPSISLATVYRNLKLLESEGKIIKLSTPYCDRFDGHTHSHFHFTCNHCGKVKDLENKGNINVESICQGYGGTVTGFSLMFFGVCPDCKAEKI
ncbi:MAG: transcriptional repressor [Acutalibacteraceae bacterium]